MFASTFKQFWVFFLKEFKNSFGVFLFLGETNCTLNDLQVVCCRFVGDVGGKELLNLFRPTTRCNVYFAE